MAGHVHAYERTAKIYKNKVDAAKGTYYVTTGAGGNYEGHTSLRLSSDKVSSWSIGVNGVAFGGSRVIATRKSLQALWFANENLDKAEAVPTDGFTIYADGTEDLSWPPSKPTDVPTTKPVSTTPAPTTGTPSQTTPAPTTSTPQPTRQAC